MAERRPIPRNPLIIGVIGGHDAPGDVLAHAEELGCAIAEKAYILLTGGGPGVMRAASRGAQRAGGLVIGILPNSRNQPLAGYPNEFVDIPVYTGMQDARNVITAQTPKALIALPGGYGTISEIAFGLKSRTPVIALAFPGLACFSHDPLFMQAETVAQAMDLLEKVLALNREVTKE
ncbi:MAG: LOG family protein [Desulfomonilia bacterium]